MALFEKPLFFLLFLLLVVGAIVVLVVLLGGRSRRPVGAVGPAERAVAAPTSEAPMTLHAGRWLRWDGTQWRDVESGSPIVDLPAPPA
jgi:hypothetical protein